MKNYPSISPKEISNTIKDFIHFLKSIIVFVFEALKRFFMVFIVLFLIIAGAGYYFTNGNNELYAAKMVCSYNYLHKKTFGEMIYRANHLAETQSYHSLAEELNIPIDAAEKVVELKATNIAKSPLHEDLTKDKLPMYFTAVVTEKEVFPHLQKGILYYLNNKIPYHQTRKELERERLNNNIEFYSSTIDQIDNLIKTYTRQIDHLKSDSTTAILEVGSLISQKEKLNAKKLGDQKMMSLQMAVELLYGFAPTEQPNLKKELSIQEVIFLAVLIAWSTVVFSHLLWPKK